jgi:hypothetical protein
VEPAIVSKHQDRPEPVARRDIGAERNAMPIAEALLEISSLFQ